MVVEIIKLLKKKFTTLVSTAERYPHLVASYYFNYKNFIVKNFVISDSFDRCIKIKLEDV